MYWSSAWCSAPSWFWTWALSVISLSVPWVGSQLAVFYLSFRRTFKTYLFSCCPNSVLFPDWRMWEPPGRPCWLWHDEPRHVSAGTPWLNLMLVLWQSSTGVSLRRWESEYPLMANRKGSYWDVYLVYLWKTFPTELPQSLTGHWQKPAFSPHGYSCSDLPQPFFGDLSRTC